MTPLFVTDLDGTLLDADARLSDTTRDGLMQLLDAGVLVTVATARSLASMREILRGVPFTLPVIEMCGAALTRLDDETRYDVADLSHDVVHDIVEIARERNMPPYLSAQADGRDHLFHEASTNDAMRWYEDDRKRLPDPRLTPVHCVKSAVAGAVLCLTFMGFEERVRDAASVISTRHESVTVNVYENPYHRGWWWASVLSERAQKGAALRRLVARHGLEDARIVAFGDTETDLSLFEAAHHAIAPANAEPAARRAADEIIPPHTEDSVVRWMLEAAGRVGA